MKPVPVHKQGLQLVEEEAARGSSVLTSIGAAIWESLQLCRALRCQGVITGPSGIGKSNVARRYAEQYSESACLFTLGVTVRCLGTLLTMIANEIGASCGRSKHALTEYIVMRLRSAPRFLLFDESHFLSWEQWEGLRQIHDQAEIGIAYIGQPRLYDQMRGKGGIYLFDQITGRMAVKKSFGNTVSIDDVRLIAESLHPGLDKKAINFLHRRCQGNGKFRVMIYILRVCEEISARENVPVDYSLIVRVARSLGL